MRWYATGLALMAWLMAQAVLAAPGYNVCYHKEHLLLAQGDGMNVVDVDVEWPEYVDGRRMEPLQEHLTQLLFRTKDTDWRRAYASWLRRLGEPVTGPLDRLPDDAAFCYITCKLEVVGHIPDKLISLRASYTSAPGRRSAQAADTLTSLFTYVLATGRVMSVGDVIDQYKLSPEHGNARVVEALLSGADADVAEQAMALELVAACVGNGCVVTDMLCLTPEGTVPVTSVTGYEVMRPVLKRDVRRVVERDPEPWIPEVFEQPQVCAGDSLCGHADTMPSFVFGGMSMGQYLADRLRWPQSQEELPAGQVTLSLVVDAQGVVREVRVVSPLHPVLDREAARVVRLMPRWMPATLGGKPVSIRCRLPISFTDLSGPPQGGRDASSEER